MTSVPGCVGGQVIEVDQQVEAALHVVVVRQLRPAVPLHVARGESVLEVALPDVSQDRLG
jgi:hypothetical protein